MAINLELRSERSTRFTHNGLDANFQTIQDAINDFSLTTQVRVPHL